MKSTKKSLVLSTLSLIMCVAMLLGTTYAWFTDSVTSGRNIIQAGNLDVELYHNGTKVTKDTSDLFKVDAWEPGVIAYENFKVVNEGSLALKYAFSLNVFDKNTYKGKDLSQVIKAVVVDGGFTPTGTTPEAKRDEAQKLSGYTSIADFQKDGHLDTKNASDTYGVVLYWIPGENDNDYNVNNGDTTDDNKDALFIEFGVTLVAIQYTYESDSFDKQYDIEAPWLGGVGELPAASEDGKIHITTAEQLAALAKEANSGANLSNKAIVLDKDIDLNNVSWTPISVGQGKGEKFVFDGNGHTVLNLKSTGKANVGLFGSVVMKEIKGVTVKNATLTGVKQIGAILGGGYTNISDCHAEDVTITADGVLEGGQYVDGAKAGGIVGRLCENEYDLTGCSVKNLTINGHRDLGGIAGCIYGNADVIGNTLQSVVINQLDNTGYETGDYTTLGAVYGRLIETVNGEPCTGGMRQDNTGDATINKAATVIVIPKDENTQSAITSAVSSAKAGETTNIVLPEGEYTITGGVENSKINVKGQLDENGNPTTKINSSKTASYRTLAAAEATFENIAFVGRNDADPETNNTQNACGFAHNGNITYKNCVFEDSHTFYNYGGVQTIENCTFNNTDTTGYALWVYGSGTYNITGCKFYATGASKGKAIKVYSNNHNVTVNVTNCEFYNESTISTNKPAIAVGIAGNGLVNVVVSGCEVNNFEDSDEAMVEWYYEYMNGALQLDRQTVGAEKADKPTEPGTIANVHVTIEDRTYNPAN